jgi:DNA mismatch repair protein MSH2
MLVYGAKKLESVVFKKSHFENFACDVVSKHYCIEIYNGSKSDRSLQFQVSPGNLTQVEDFILGSTDITSKVGILAQNWLRKSNRMQLCGYLSKKDTCGTVFRQ